MEGFSLFAPKTWKISLGAKNKEVEVLEKVQPQAFWGGECVNSFAVSFNGEKNLGEIGPIKIYNVDYASLRARSWQAYLDSEIAQTVLKKWCIWLIGKGLKVQSEPSKLLFELSKVTIDIEKFNNTVEAKFSLFANSKRADYSNMVNLHKISKRALLNAVIGGDVLIVQRFENGQQTIQLIDGANVQSTGTVYTGQKLDNGNLVKDGVELSPSGEHVAYYVKTAIGQYERILAKNSEGMTVAYLYCPLEYRLDGVRGLPLIAVMMETLAQLERYKTATLGSAEERQKIAYTIEHNQGSTGENPLQAQMQKIVSANAKSDTPTNAEGEILAKKISATTNKATINMPIGSKLESLESKNELYFSEFYSTNITLLCASLNIPAEVALSKYDSNFSASRAAIQDWAHVINVNRADFTRGFYTPIYDNWLYMQILQNKIDAPGYLRARMSANWDIVDNYHNTWFDGPNVPHIDPLKEVQAVRLKLGDAAANIPLCTVEQGTRQLGTGDADSNMTQFAEELKTSIKSGISVDPNKSPGV